MVDSCRLKQSFLPAPRASHENASSPSQPPGISPGRGNYPGAALAGFTPAAKLGLQQATGATPLGRHRNQHGYPATVFFPEKAGKDYASTPYLEKLQKTRGRMTVLSGVSHPGVTGAHAAEKCFLTGTPHPERGGFRNGISLDQFAAERVGNQTRYPSLVLAMSSENNQTLSFTRRGAPIPAERSPNRSFQNSSFKEKRKKSPPPWKLCGRNKACSISSPSSQGN